MKIYEIFGPSGNSGGPTVAFTTMQTDAGTAPVADSASDTLTFTSSDGSIVVTGNSTTDTIDLTLGAVMSTQFEGQFDDASTVLPAEDGFAVVRITQQRAAHVNLRTAAGVEILPATAANQATEITALQLIDDIIIAQGAVATGAKVAIMGGIDLSGNATVPTMVSAGGINVFGVIPLDSAGNQVDYTSAGVQYSFVAGTSASKATAVFLRADANSNLQTVGAVAHDGVDADNPIKIGGKATTSTSGPTAVADADRTNQWYSAQGLSHGFNHSHKDLGTALTALNDDYDNVTLTNSSADVTRLGYRYADILMTVDFTGTAGTVILQVSVEPKSGSNYFQPLFGYQQDIILPASAYATAKSIQLRVTLPCTELFRVTLTSTGSTASNFWTVTNAEIRMAT